METQWVEALASVNNYVRQLAIDNVDTGVTLATFDKDVGRLQFDIIRDRIIPRTWRPVSSADAQPRGGTPLFDAVGKIVDLAERGNYDKVAIIIMTDGEENSSVELNINHAKGMLDRCRGRNWQVIFLGANFDNLHQSSSLGAHVNQSVSAARGTYTAHTQLLAEKRAVYGATGQSISMSEAEKQALNTTGGAGSNTSVIPPANTGNT